MGLFKSKKSSRRKGSVDLDDIPQQTIEGPSVTVKIIERTRRFSQPAFKYAPLLSKTKLNLGGLPVNVFGLKELTPSYSRASAPAPPEVCVVIHMHGRGGTADNEEGLVRHLYDRANRSAQEQGGSKRRELLIVNFDARNHGQRLTNEAGQKGWKQGNTLHALDLYAMIVGMAQDASFIVDFLPPYLFPHGDRTITKWVITGKSLGGHAAWHVLANDSRITIGVPFISCPSYSSLMADRARTSFVAYGPPHVPASLSALISKIDPASRPYDSFDPAQNPFWGKQICMCSGEADKLVPWQCAEVFARGLVTGEVQGARSEPAGFRVVLLEGVGHTVTETMIEEGGHWIYLHGVQ
ncbi:hypothetical protein CBS101457_006595 [Exobasidium rhododendri]|nr:hypothetical protein CBS101457_006595 [Exobasidium rhododendri]